MLQEGLMFPYFLLSCSNYFQFAKCFKKGLGIEVSLKLVVTFLSFVNIRLHETYDVLDRT